MGPVAELFAWLHLLPALAGFVVSVSNLGRSRWAALLAAGFAGQLLAQLFYRVATRLLVGGMLRSGGAEVGFGLASLVGLGAAVAIVVGVAGLLRDARK